MTRPVLIIISFALIACAFIAGCTSDSGTTPVTTAVPATAAATPTAAPVTVSATASAVVSDAGSIEAMPSAQTVNLELTKDRPTSKISLLYQGGAGEVFTQKITMRVYSSDTEYKEYVMSDGAKPIPGNEIIAMGTRSGDRCVVYVQSAGTTYKVIDKKVYADL
ncbi:hypothetical protein [Methanoregula sp.]|uniref:hypothetical protein n=1 Tax=Methanoregula sp. TaxID=2052170 RepID=UPI0023692A80|nr:hypothetical protein [Methanoregula sp.]MDD1686925.1 hypothetical protein [Methanoregula sp.]